MNAWFMLQLAISILQGIVTRTQGTADDAIVAGIQAALKEIEKVRGTPVTKEQLESLRTEPKW